MYQPFYPPYHPPTDEDIRRRQEKQSLRRDAAYIGTLSIALTLVLQFAFSFIVLFLVKCGVFSIDDLEKANLGLSNTAYMFLYMSVYSLSLLIPTLIVSFCFKKRFSPFTPAKPVPFGAAFLSILAAVGLCMLANVINSYILYYFKEMGLYVPDAPQTMVETPTSLALNLLTMAVLPGLLEEMIYRGYILRTLRAYGDWFAILISSLLFSLMHGNLRQIPFAFIVGLVLGLLYVCTNNIWLPIAVHFANNAISVMMEYFSFSLPTANQNVFYTLVIYSLIALGMLCVLAFLIIYLKRLRFSRNNTTLSFAGRFGVIFSSPLFIIAIVLYVLLLFLGAA